jgi:acetylcholinesterase
MRSTTDELRKYLAEFYFPGANTSSIDKILALYPADPAQGSPFDTGDMDEITPQYKRISALLGDIVFQAPRRFYLKHRSSRQPTFAFCPSPPLYSNLIADRGGCSE